MWDERRKRTENWRCQFEIDDQTENKYIFFPHDSQCAQCKSRHTFDRRAAITLWHTSFNFEPSTIVVAISFIMSRHVNITFPMPQTCLFEFERLFFFLLILSSLSVVRLFCIQWSIVAVRRHIVWRNEKVRRKINRLLTRWQFKGLLLGDTE